MKTASRVNRKTQIAFGSAILALIVVGAISYRAILTSRESNQWVQHTREVIESLDDLDISLETVESSTRGFVLTGKESYLGPYRTSLIKEQQDEVNLRSLTTDNPAQQLLLPALSKLAADKFERDAAVITLRRTQGLQAASDDARSGTGQQIMIDFQSLISQMKDEEQRLLVIRTADSEHSLGQTRSVLIFGTVMGLLITIAAGWSVQRDSAARAIAEGALREGEERFRTLLANSIPQLAWMADEKGYIFWVQPALV